MRLAPAVALLLLAGSAAAWFPPDEDLEGAPNVHGVILLRAIEVLRADGYTRAADLFTRYRRSLLQGVRDADKGLGFLEEDVLMEALDRKVLAKRPRNIWERLWKDRRPRVAAVVDRAVPFGIPVAPFTHFYNPRTGKGLHMRLGAHHGYDLDAALPLLARFTVIPWEWATLYGPHMASVARVEWDYALAVDAMRAAAEAPLDLVAESEPVDRQPTPALEAAMTHLGRALHFAGDATVPPHADDDGSQDPASKHMDFERRAEALVREPDFPHAASGALEVAGGPGDMVRLGADRAVPWIEAAQGAGATRDQAIRAMVPLAERLTAGLMLRFLRLWRSEARPVVGVKVEDLERLRGHDWTSKEDFVARLAVGNSRFETGVLSGADRIRPQVYLPDAWFHVAPVPAGERVTVEVSLEEDDNGDRTAVDIVPGAAGPALRLQVDPDTGEVSGPGATGVVGQALELRGDARGRARARVVLRVERLPRPAGPLQCEEPPWLAGGRSVEPGFEDLGGTPPGSSP